MLSYIKTLLHRIVTIGENHDVIKRSDVGFTYVSWNPLSRMYYVCIYTYSTHKITIVSKGFSTYNCAKNYALNY